MRIAHVLWFLALVGGQAVSASTPEAVPLSGENLSFASRTLDPHLDWKAYTKDYFEYAYPQRFSSVMHDQSLVDAELIKYEAELRKQAQSGARNLQTLELEGEIIALEKDPKKAKVFNVQIANLLSVGIKTIESKAHLGGQYIRPAYILLLANGNLGSHFPLKEGLQTREYQAAREAGETIIAYLSVDVELVQFHQNIHVSSVLRRVRWFKDAARTQLLGEVRETAPTAQLMKGRYLSEGATLHAEPDHSVTIADFQPLELLEQDAKNRTCIEQKREKGHRVFDCTMVYGKGTSENSRVIYRYVGGRLAKYTLFAAKSDTALEEGQILGLMSARYGVRVANLMQKNRWTGACCEYSMDLEQFATPGTKPYLEVTTLAYKALLQGDAKFAVKP